MLKAPPELQIRFERCLEVAGVASHERSEFRKWLRFYLDFCGKYGFPDAERRSLPSFLSKLASKNQSPARREQAGRAVGLYL